jgi:UDP-glucose 4-epimerase
MALKVANDSREATLGASEAADTARSTEILKGKKILVTGGAGFVGSHIVDLLVETGCDRIVVIDNMVRGSKANLAAAVRSGKVDLIVGDIRDRSLLAKHVPGCDTVFLQAALRITHCAAEPRAAIEVMVDATFELVEECRKADVRKIVMASSASVYGMAESFPTNEQHHHYGNRTLYGAAKSFAEGLLRSYNDMFGTAYICLRYFNVYGPRMDIHGKYTEVLIRWMERLEIGEPPIIFGDGTQTMDFLHVVDVARANILSAISPASDVSLNVGSGTETSLYSLARQLARVMDRSETKPLFREARAVNPVPRRLSDINAARRIIGFETTIPLEDGLRELVRWWRHQRQASIFMEATA